MKYLVAFALLSFSVSSPAAVNAAKAKELANNNACLNCHGVSNRIVGPGFNEVAAKYKDDKQATTALAKKIKAGGSGVWGSVPMPGNPHLSDADAKLLAQWVLSGGK